MSKYVVTGISGFVANNLARKLLSQGHKVLGIDWKECNLEELQENKNFKFANYDLSIASHSFKGYDGVFHLAFLPRVKESIDFPIPTNDNNIRMILVILEQMRKDKVKNIVFASSSSVYGDTVQIPTTEKAPKSPLSPYAVQKLACENYLWVYKELHKINYIALRYFNVYGEYQNPEGSYANLIPKTIMRCLEGKKPIIFGKGNKTRDFCYIDDVLDATIKSMEYLQKNKTMRYRIFNVCSGTSYSVLSVVKAIMQKTQYKGKIDFQKEIVEPENTQGDYTLIKEVLGWEPKVNLDTGLDIEIAYFKNMYGR